MRPHPVRRWFAAPRVWDYLLTARPAPPRTRLGLVELEPREMPALLAGAVFHDLDGNGQRAASEPGLAGVTVALLNSLNETVADATTAADGSYSLDADPGEYTLAFTASGGFRFGASNAAEWSIPFTLPADGATRDAGAFRLASLTGTAINEDTGDVLAGVGVTLSLDGFGPVGSATTGADGSFAFNDLAPGTYLAAFTAPTGYRIDPSEEGAWSGEADVISETGGTLDVWLYPDLALTVPDDLTVDAGASTTLTVQATAGAGVSDVTWWVSYDGEDYATVPDLTGLTPQYAFPTYGEYDVWVEVTDGNGNTAEDGFHVTVNEVAPTAAVTASGPVDEGGTVTFTLNEVDPDTLDAVTILADWDESGEFHELTEDDYRVNADGTISFDHVYTWAKAGGGAYQAKIRVEDDGGQNNEYTVPVTVNPVAPQATLYTGGVVSTAAASGLDLWWVGDSEKLEFRNVTVPEGHEDDLTYHWMIDGQVQPDTEESFISLPEYKHGRIYDIEAWVTDSRGLSTPHIERKVLVVVWQGYLDDWFSVTALTSPLPEPRLTEVFGNAYVQEMGLSPLDSPFVHGENTNLAGWADDTPLHVKVDLDPVTVAFAGPGAITYTYYVDEWLGHVGGAPDRSREFTNTSGILELGGWPKDSHVRIRTVVTLPNGGSEYLGFAIDVDTVKSQPGFLDSLQKLWQLVERLGDKGSALISSIRNDPDGIFAGAGKIVNTFSQALGGAITEFSNDLIQPAKLQAALFKWLFNGPLPAGFENLDASTLADPNKLISLGLQYAGLTWDHVYEVALKQLGSGNMAALESVFNWFGGDDPIDPTDADSMYKLVDRLRQASGDVNLDLDAILTGVQETLPTIIAQSMARAGAHLAAKFVPGAGMIASLYQGVEWALQNFTEQNGLFDQLLAGFDDLIAGDVGQLKNTLVTAFEKALPALMDLAARQLGLGKLREDLKNALKFIPEKVDQALNKAIATVAARVTVVAGGGTSSKMFDGKLAAERTFHYGDKDYVLWAAQEGSVVKVKVAEKVAGGYKLIGELNTKSFDDANGAGPDGLTPTQHIADLATKARSLYQGTRKNTQQPPPGKTTLPNLKALQAAVTAAEDKVVADILANACKALNAGCFAAGTKLLTRAGWRAVEAIEPGDEVLSRSEFDPAGDTGWKVVEARFERTGRILHLHAGGEVVRTTPEHPFYVDGAGWTPAGMLKAGDRIASLSGEWVAVEEAFDTGEYEPVYNLRVADFHTYFVGNETWGFALWAHNEYTEEVNDIIKKLVVNVGKVAPKSGFSYEAGRTGGRGVWATRSYLVEHLQAMLDRYYTGVQNRDQIVSCAATRILRLSQRDPYTATFVPQNLETYHPTQPVVPAGVTVPAHQQYMLTKGGVTIAPVSANLNQGGWDVALGNALGDTWGRGSKKAKGVYIIRDTVTGRIYKVGKAEDNDGLVGRLERYAADFMARGFSQGIRITAEVYKLGRGTDYATVEQVLRGAVIDDGWVLTHTSGAADGTADEIEPQGTGGWTVSRI